MRKNKNYGLLTILMFVVLAFVACGDDDEDNPNAGPQPSITAITPTQVSLGQRNTEGRIQGQNLSGVVAVDLGASIAVHRVQSISASEVLVEFTVGRDAAPGMRTISVSTSAGTAQSAAIFNVQNNQVPTVQFSIDPKTASKNSTVTFDASATTDQDGTPQGYAWNFGDGKSANGKIVTHKYANAGTFEVELNVTDNHGGSNFTRRSLDVENNQGPIARFSFSPAEGDTNTEYTFDGSDSTDNDGRVMKHVWNFDDGTKAEGKKVKHVFKSDKAFNVTLTVTDNDGATGEKVKEVKVERGGGGGGGGGCGGKNDVEPSSANACGGFVGQSVCVVSVQGSSIVTSDVVRRCPGLCGEFRRNADGIREFVGDIIRIDGTRVSLDYGRLPASTRPSPGERIKAIWRPQHQPGQPNCK